MLLIPICSSKFNLVQSLKKTSGKKVLFRDIKKLVNYQNQITKHYLINKVDEQSTLGVDGVINNFIEKEQTVPFGS